MLQAVTTKYVPRFTSSELDIIHKQLCDGATVEQIRVQFFGGLPERTFYYRLKNSGKRIVNMRGLADLIPALSEQADSKNDERSEAG